MMTALLIADKPCTSYKIWSKDHEWFTSSQVTSCILYLIVSDTANLPGNLFRPSSRILWIHIPTWYNLRLKWAKWLSDSWAKVARQRSSLLTHLPFGISHKFRLTYLSHPNSKNYWRTHLFSTCLLGKDNAYFSLITRVHENLGIFKHPPTLIFYLISLYS